MAKQSGIHQLKGKVRGMSYYRTAGVSDGLVRTINEGLSSRVKESPEYANTRLNNAEFGLAANTAAALQSMLPQKWRYMFRRFAQAHIAKDLIEQIKLNSGAWGQRGFTPEQRENMLPLISSYAKFPFSQVMDNVEITYDASRLLTRVDYYVYASTSQTLIQLGADGFEIWVTPTILEVGKYQSGTGKYSKSIAHLGYSAGSSVNVYSPADELDDFLGIDDQVWPRLVSPIGDTKRLLVISVFPYKTIGGVNHILQEYCSFKTFDAPIQ